MKAIKCVVALVVTVLANLTPLQSQQPATPDVYQILYYIKVPPAGRPEFLQLMRDSNVKVAETRLKAGEIISWTLIKSVYPAGSEARADYAISMLCAGIPSEPLDRAGNEALFKQAGVTGSYTEYQNKRDQISSLVSAEMWRVDSRVGALKKGHYLYINRMKVTDGRAYIDFERNVWRPMAEQRVKAGEMSGWMVAVKELPAGTDTPYSFYTVDMFASWAAAFKEWSPDGLFKQVHPGKNIDESFAHMEKIRSMGTRELWVVEERVAK